MWKRIGSLSVFIVLVFHTLAFAHGDGTPIMGTVTDLDAQHVEVKTKKGKAMSVSVNDKTTYYKAQTQHCCHRPQSNGIFTLLWLLQSPTGRSYRGGRCRTGSRDGT